MVAIDVFVPRRSDAGIGGDAAFFSLVLRESHEKGLVSFLVGAAGAGRDECFSFAAGGAGGGGGNLTGDIVPDRPVRPELDGCLGGSAGSGLCGFSPSAFAWLAFRSVSG